MGGITALRRWVGALVRAPRMEHEIRELKQCTEALKSAHAALSHQFKEFADGLADMHRAFDARNAAMAEQRQALESSFAAARASIDEHRIHIAELEAATIEVATSRRDQAVRTEQDLAALHARLNRIVPPFPEVPKAPGADGQSSLMAVFEEMFRGTPDEIRERLASYVDDAVEAATRTGCPTVLDIGCGRGDWQDLVRARDIEAIGVDSSTEMVNACRAAGHDARQHDALAFLQSVSPASYAMVTAFHVVEHLPVATLLSATIEAARVLVPGGILLMETPNPDNMIVGSNTFWLDPTHLRPLPARLLRFLVEASGFEVLAVRFNGPDPDVEAMAVREGWPAGLKQLIGGPRDYAIIARKPES